MAKKQNEKPTLARGVLTDLDFKRLALLLHPGTDTKQVSLTGATTTLPEKQANVFEDVTRRVDRNVERIRRAIGSVHRLADAHYGPSPSGAATADAFPAEGSNSALERLAAASNDLLDALTRLDPLAR